MRVAVQVRGLDDDVFHVPRVHRAHRVPVARNEEIQERRRRHADRIGLGDNRPRRYLPTR